MGLAIVRNEIASFLGLVPEEDSVENVADWDALVDRATPCYVFCSSKRHRW
jgi:hypothetical protein